MASQGKKVLKAAESAPQPQFARWLLDYLARTGFKRSDVAFFIRRDQNTINAWCSSGRQKPHPNEQPRLKHLLEEHAGFYRDLIDTVEALYATGRTSGLRR